MTISDEARAKRGSRKPLAENCDGSITCPSEDHVQWFSTGQGSRVAHIKLTQGQRRTLRERRAKALNALGGGDRADTPPTTGT